MTPITLSFQFSSIDQLTEFCARCVPHKTHAEVTNPSVTHPIVTPVQAEIVAQLDAAGVDPIPAKKRGRPAKAVAPAIAEPIDVVRSVAQATTAPTLPTHQDAVAAQTDLYNYKGAEVCIALLQRHGALRVSQIKPEQRERFIQDCKDAKDGKDLSAAA